MPRILPAPQDGSIGRAGAERSFDAGRPTLDPTGSTRRRPRARDVGRVLPALALLVATFEFGTSAETCRADDPPDKSVLWETPINPYSASARGDEGLPAAFSPDSKLVALCVGRAIEIRRVADGTVEKRIGDLPRSAGAVAWSPDASLLAVTTVGETDDIPFQELPREPKPEWRTESEIHLWQTADGKLRARCNGHRMHVVGVEFSPDGRRLLSFGVDNTMRLWDVHDGTELAVFETDVINGNQNRGWARRGGFTHDPPALVTAEPGEIVIRDPVAGRRLATIDTLNANGSAVPIALSPRGRLAFCSRDVLADAAALWRYEESIKRKAEGRPPLPPEAAPPVDPKRHGGDYLMTARLLPLHGTKVKVEGADTQVVLRGARGKIIDDRHSYDAVYFSADGKRAVTYRRNAENVTEAAVWDAAIWAPIPTERPPRDPQGFPFRPPIFTPDLRYMIVEWMFCDLKTGKWSVPDPQIPGNWELSPDGTKLLSVDRESDAARVTVRDFEAVLKSLGPYNFQ